MESSLEIDENDGDLVIVDHDSGQPSPTLGYSTWNPAAAVLSMPMAQPQPKKTEGRVQYQRPRTIDMDDEKCHQLLERLMASASIKDKATRIQELRTQLLTQMAEQRHPLEVSIADSAHVVELAESDQVQIIIPTRRRQNRRSSRDLASGPPSAAAVLPIEDEVAAGDNNLNIHRESSHYVVPVDGNSLEELGPDGLEGLEMAYAPQSDIFHLVHWLTGINRNVVVDHVHTGSLVVKDLALGHVTGYVVAAFLSKFGKMFFCSTAGSALFLKIAQDKGYINIDWNRISDAMLEGPDYLEIDEMEGGVPCDGSDCEGGENRQLPEATSPQVKAGCSIVKKIVMVGDWIRENPFVAAGLVLGFAFRTYSSRH